MNLYTLAHIAMKVVTALARKANHNNAADVLVGVQSIVETYQQAAEGKITPEQARDSMAKLERAIASNDADADAAAAKKPS